MIESLINAMVVDINVDKDNNIIGLMLCTINDTYFTVDTVKHSWR